MLPDNLAGIERVMKFIVYEISPYSYINLMDQYYPKCKASRYPEFDRKITRTEFREAVLTVKMASPHFRLVHERV